MVFVSFYVIGGWGGELCEKVVDDDKSDLDDRVPKSICVLLFDVRKNLLQISAEKPQRVAFFIALSVSLALFLPVSWALGLVTLIFRFNFRFTILICKIGTLE